MGTGMLGGQKDLDMAMATVRVIALVAG